MEIFEVIEKNTLINILSGLPTFWALVFIGTMLKESNEPEKSQHTGFKP